jgi:alcohol dehydrogenase, propanol-preferring
MKAMRMVAKQRPLELKDDMARPKPLGSSLVVKVESAGVCHSDIHMLEGKYDIGHGNFLNIEDIGVKLPMTPGHEVAGTVEELGSDFRGDLKKGDQVVVYPEIGCGSCRACADGKYNLCDYPSFIGLQMDGGFAEYVLVPDARYVAKANGVSSEAASIMACAGLTAYSAFKNTQLTEDDFLGVIGLGGLGSMAVQFAKRLSGASIVALDIDNRKLDLASRLGANYTVNSSQGNAASKISEITNGRGLDAVIDFVGNNKTSKLGFENIAKRGRLVLVGLAGGTLELPLVIAINKAVKVIGNFTGSPRDLQQILDMLRRGEIKPPGARVFALEDANTALEELRQGNIEGRAVLKV